MVTRPVSESSPDPHRRPRPRSGRRSLVAVVVGAMVLVLAPATLAFAEPPRAIPQKATAGDLKWEPAMDYDGDGCYPTPAISADAVPAVGLKLGGGLAENCSDVSDLENTNAYVRTWCQGEWCAHKYAYYFEKDQATNGPPPTGHQNDLEHIVVWVQNDQVRYVAASGHGSYQIRAADEVQFEGTHPKMVYNKDGISTHRMRHASPADDPPENPKHTWQLPALLSWELMDPHVRDVFAAHNYGAASLALKDSVYADDLKKSSEEPPDPRRVVPPLGIPFDFKAPLPSSDPPAVPAAPTNPYRTPTRTFTVTAGATSFATTQPENSVATYTWTAGGRPQEWLTSADGGGLDHKLAPMPVASYADPSDRIDVDEGRTYQPIDGFGGAMTDSAASLIAGSPARDTIMRRLFGTGEGEAGLTMVRSPMGSSDLMADGADLHTYEDVRGSFSAVAQPSDRRQIDVLGQAKSITGGDFKLLGTPWSAPGWAKRGGSLLPKQCGTDENELDLAQVQDYAGYFKRYVDAYTFVGLKPWMVSMQNEPENCKTEMPTTLLSPTDEVALAKELKSQLPGDVKVLGWDHNWNDEDYVDTLTGQGAGSVDAIGYHCYDGTHYATQTQAVPTYMTECSGWTDQSGDVAANTSGDVASNLGWEVSNTLIGPLRNGSRGSMYWSLAQDPSGNPHLAGNDACKNCRGMITVDGGGFEPSQDFYYWAQFSKFVRPGAVRVASSNVGDLSTVAFRDGNRTTLVVLNSASHADGGSAGSDERDLRGHVVQYSGDSAAQKAAWFVGADGYRRWIGDGSTYNCLKYDAGAQGPDDVSGGALDKYINLKDVWAVCGTGTMGTRSELENGTYLKSTGGARLTLTRDGLRSVDSGGKPRWAPPGTGDRLVLQEDQNLVLYAGTRAVWSSETKGSGAIWLSIRDDGTFALFDKDDKKVWTSTVDAKDYRRAIVQWDGDPSPQKTAWLVGTDGHRRVIHDHDTFQCLHDAGAGDAVSVSSDVLDSASDLTGVWATCGTDRIGADGALEQGSHLTAGDYTLTLTSDDLVLAKGGTKVWSNGHGGTQLKLQVDGNLVEYEDDGHVSWATDTKDESPGWLVLGDDGSLRLSDGSGREVWTR